MKRLYPLMTAGLLSVLPLCAQKPLVLIEEFTNTGCGPCASWSPVLDATIDYHLEQGKPTLRMDKVNQLLDLFNYELTATPKQ